jgi:hypothetical protein
LSSVALAMEDFSTTVAFLDLRSFSEGGSEGGLPPPKL